MPNCRQTTLLRTIAAEIQSQPLIAIEAVEAVLKIPIDNQEAYLWLFVFVVKVFLSKVLILRSDLLGELFNKLQSYNWQQFYCPVFIRRAVEKIHPLVLPLSSPNKLKRVALKLGNLNPVFHEIFAVLVSVAFREYFKLPDIDFEPWPPKQFLELFNQETQTFDYENDELNCINFLRLTSNYLAFNLQNPLLEDFHGESNEVHKKHFSFDKETEVAIKAALKEWVNRLLGEIVAKKEVEERPDLDRFKRALINNVVVFVAAAAPTVKRPVDRTSRAEVSFNLNDTQHAFELTLVTPSKVPPAQEDEISR